MLCGLYSSGREQGLLLISVGGLHVAGDSLVVEHRLECIGFSSRSTWA